MALRWYTVVVDCVDVAAQAELDFRHGDGSIALFNGMSGTLTGVPETRSWNDANGDKTIINADGSIQTNEVLGGTSSFGQVTSRPDPNLPRSPELCGPEMTPSRKYPGPAMIASRTIPTAELPTSCVLVLGKP